MIYHDQPCIFMISRLRKFKDCILIHSLYLFFVCQTSSEFEPLELKFCNTKKIRQFIFEPTVQISSFERSSTLSRF